MSKVWWTSCLKAKIKTLDQELKIIFRNLHKFTTKSTNLRLCHKFKTTTSPCLGKCTKTTWGVTNQVARCFLTLVSRLTSMLNKFKFTPIKTNNRLQKNNLLLKSKLLEITTIWTTGSTRRLFHGAKDLRSWNSRNFTQKDRLLAINCEKLFFLTKMKSTKILGVRKPSELSEKWSSCNHLQLRTRQLKMRTEFWNDRARLKMNLSSRWGKRRKF